LGVRTHALSEARSEATRRSAERPDGRRPRRLTSPRRRGSSSPGAAPAFAARGARDEPWPAGRPPRARSPGGAAAAGAARAGTRGGEGAAAGRRQGGGGGRRHDERLAGPVAAAVELADEIPEVGADGVDLVLELTGGVFEARATACRYAIFSFVHLTSSVTSW